ncbi:MULTISPECIES: class I SAM-dependent methyltransferase [unclassified Crossiella]|uniref:class I SAM-dependent methyltransferase n=1 Tax=unclassified Crossiella TaxID=2620835 RepID=UPI00200028F7|nr:MULTISPECIES: class I SAM-dependent methyltransferase [unclassified Crossiella]MCK2238802.1 class I SAM-dependent methyltransferase [Crossiella sp. S99.2]MCK2251628.1 class I SAM-dependent methyltransferase [Crossiella sp. S99.1]
MRAHYDDIADWYEHDFLAAQQGSDLLELARLLADLLGPGSGPCLEIGCGTGAHAGRLRALGWNPVGLDISCGMLGHASAKLPVAQADAESLPIADSSLAAVVTVLTHTDMPGYPAVLREVARVLRPGGVFVHLGVHPCFCGGFADRSEPAAIVINPGYRDTYWTTASWTADGLRDKVGATHRPLPDLLNEFLAAGLVLERFAEGGSPTPVVLGIRTRKE